MVMLLNNIKSCPTPKNHKPIHGDTDAFTFEQVDNHYADDRLFIFEMFNRVPPPYRKALANKYSKLSEQNNRYGANTLLRKVNALCDNLFYSSSDEALAVKARNFAEFCEGLKHNLGTEKAYQPIVKYAEGWGVKVLGGYDRNGVVSRLCDHEYWVRKLLKNKTNKLNQIATLAGVVNRKQQIYVSDLVLNAIKDRAQRSYEIMQGLELINEMGETLEMSDVLEGSIANPKNRRAELMTRICGFEEYANKRDHVGVFYTVTCPSKYHPNSFKYEGFTPKESAEYLSSVWAKARANLNRNDLRPYGFRVAEPHHDGCPHWHILLFMPKEHEQQITQTLKEYFIAEDLEELKGNNAKNIRFNAKHLSGQVNPKTGEPYSAASYIAKYISKNIDGFGFGDGIDYESGQTTVSEGAERVRAWASCHGIRQFQQMGGAGVGIWRELRKLPNNQQVDETLEAARKAADDGDWCGFQEAMGGVLLPSKDRKIKIHSVNHYANFLQTGEVFCNKYGEIVPRVLGLDTPSGLCVTRLHDWTIRFKLKSQATDAEAEASAPWGTVNNCTQLIEAPAIASQITHKNLRENENGIPITRHSGKQLQNSTFH